MATPTLEPLPSPDDPLFDSIKEVPSSKIHVGKVFVLSFILILGLLFEGTQVWFSMFWEEVLFLISLMFSLEGVFFLAILVASLPLLIFVHEAGHVIGGKLAGFRFMLLSVGPLVISKRTGGLKVTLDKNQMMLGGLTSMYPTDLKNLGRRKALLIAGWSGHKPVDRASFLGSFVYMGA